MAETQDRQRAGKGDSDAGALEAPRGGVRVFSIGGAGGESAKGRKVTGPRARAHQGEPMRIVMVSSSSRKTSFLLDGTEI